MPFPGPEGLFYKMGMGMTREARSRLRRLVDAKARTEDQISYYLLLDHIIKLINNNNSCYAHLRDKQTVAQAKDLVKTTSI